MNRPAALFGLAALLLASAPAPALEPRPNVILIFVDDLGYGDVEFTGAQDKQTPNLTRMAEQGRVFTDFYVGCPVCSGSRTALMTGCHFARLGVAPVLFPNSNEGLHPDEVTLADMLRDAGYKTACIGKWHLGHLPPCLPTYQGFDQYYGVPYSNDMWLDPANELADDLVVREGLTREEVVAGHKRKNWVPLMRGEKVIEYPADQATLTKRYTEEAVRFIDENRDASFFLYLPHTMVHLPLAASNDFQGTTDSLLGDAIAEVDWSVGEILDAVVEAGIGRKTLVIFTSDNGAAVGSSKPLRAKKASLYDGGIREPTVMRWTDAIPAGTTCSEVAATIDLMPTLAHLCYGKLPERKIDGKDITSLINGAKLAKSPHDAYVLMHNKGCVRAGKWKYYPWPEGQERGRGDASADAPAVQLYEISTDIGETTNVASDHPDVVARLQQAHDEHVAEIEANRRPTAKLQRRDGSPSAIRP